MLCLFGLLANPVLEKLNSASLLSISLYFAAVLDFPQWADRAIAEASRKQVLAVKRAERPNRLASTKAPADGLAGQVRRGTALQMPDESRQLRLLAC